jgi:hypothetical protein
MVFMRRDRLNEITSAQSQNACRWKSAAVRKVVFRHPLAVLTAQQITVGKIAYFIRWCFVRKFFAYQTTSPARDRPFHNREWRLDKLLDHAQLKAATSAFIPLAACMSPRTVFEAFLTPHFVP